MSEMQQWRRWPRSTPLERAGEATGKLLPLLGSQDDYLHNYVPAAAAEALAKITPLERAGEVTGKLLPLLGSPVSDVPAAAAEALDLTDNASSGSSPVSRSETKFSTFFTSGVLHLIRARLWLRLSRSCGNIGAPRWQSGAARGFDNDAGRV
jgi:hypothetical protein